jgi:serine/threonine protein phosphatase PrpC
MDDMIETEPGRIELQKIKNGDSGDSDNFNKGDSYAGCTANVALIANNKLYVANAGDSRSVLGMSNDVAFPMSIDHKPDDEPEKRRITDAGGFVTDGRVNGNLNLSRALGDMEYKN